MEPGVKERVIMEKTRPQGQQDLLEIFRGRGVISKGQKDRHI